MPPTAKKQTLEERRSRIEFWINHWNFSAKLNRTRTGNPLPAAIENPYRNFHQIFDGIVEGYDNTKSTGFEGRIRAGLKGVWLESIP